MIYNTIYSLENVTKIQTPIGISPYLQPLLILNKLLDPTTLINLQMPLHTYDLHSIPAIETPLLVLQIVFTTTIHIHTSHPPLTPLLSTTLTIFPSTPPNLIIYSNQRQHPTTYTPLLLNPIPENMLQTQNTTLNEKIHHDILTLTNLLTIHHHKNLKPKSYG